MAYSYKPILFAAVYSVWIWVSQATALAETGNAHLRSSDMPTVISSFSLAGAIGNKWNRTTNTLAYGLAGEDGRYSTYLSNIDGSSSHRLNFKGWGLNKHEFPAAWHPSGRYLVMTIEKPIHSGSSVDATPGYGGYSDYWLVVPDGSKAWKIVDLPNDHDHAITHAAFSPDGTKFIWTERIKAPAILNPNLAAGAYEFNVANFVDGPHPHLSNIQNLIPGGKDQGGEVESIADDDQTIAFYSTYITHNLFASRIYTMNIQTGKILELTTESWSQAPTFTPDCKHIVYITGDHADIFPWSLQGADWWIMDVGGGHKHRLTYMNVRDSPQSDNRFRLAGSLSFISDTTFLGDVMTKSLGLVGNIVRIEIIRPFPSSQ